MKVLITDDQLDSLLSIKISSDGGKTYTDYNVSSLKENGVTFNCSPNDLKVICDANVLKYIQVLADGEKLTSNVDLNDYLKYRDVYIDVYKNPYYGVTLPQNEIDKLSGKNSFLYYRSNFEHYCSSENFMLYALEDTKLVSLTNDSIQHYFGEFFTFNDGGESNNICFLHYDTLNKLDDFYYVSIVKSRTYLNSEVFRTNVRVHFIKHF